MAKTQLKFLLMFVCILGSQAAKVAQGQCLTFLGNTVVYEGTENAILSCGLRPSEEKWTVRPTSNAITEYPITNFTGSVSPTLTGLYAVNQSGLIIRNATIDPTAADPISTAGLYYVYFADGNTALAKLVVIRSGPDCSWTRSASGGTNITCTIIYADHPVSPINATISCTADGQVYTATPTKTLIIPYLYDSTTVITISNSSAATYDCRAAFTAPVDNRTSNLARNEPNFTANVTALEIPTTSVYISDQCLRTLRNMAVHEGQRNTIMNLLADPQKVSWKVIPTSDELSTYDIINIGGYIDPSLTNLYDLNKTGLVIKKATTTRGKNGNPISTAGLYIGECANNGIRTGAKLLVVRKGPQCLINSTSSSVSCNVTFADFTLDAMYPIITWKLNGAYLTSDTLRTERIDPDVFYAESTITIISGAPNNYRCELTFAAPTDVEYPWIAKNAPKFKKSCSIRG